jgi:hypothetical protein
MKNNKTILAISILLIGLLFACLPLFGKGYIPTHDGEYHIIRFIEFFRMLSAGYWFPRWAPTLNSGYGIPIFSFHYPLPNYIGAFFLGIGFDAVMAFKLSLALGYISAGIFSFFWLRKLFGIKAGLVGSVVSSLVPYWFVDLFVRGSVGEVWAIAFMFAALFFCEYGLLIPFSIAIGILILSHNILAMVFLPFLFGWALIRNKRLIIGYLFGLLLSAYFWIPAILERNNVVGLNTVNFREHFAQLYELIIPSWGTALSGATFGGDKMSFQIGIVPLILLFGSLVFGLKEKNVGYRKIYWYIFVFFVLSIYFILPYSSIFWESVPLVSFVQYPWRFLSFIIPITAFMGAYISYHIRARIVSIGFIFLSVIVVYSYTRPVIYAPRDSVYYLSRENFTDGTSSMGNSFSTRWTSWKSKRPEYLLEVINGQITGDFPKNTYLEKKFTVTTENGADVHVPILYYPGWSVILDQKESAINYQKDGTIRFAVPQGTHDVIVSFRETTTRKIADIVSIITLVWLIGWGILEVYAYSIKHSIFNRRTH